MADGARPCGARGLARACVVASALAARAAAQEPARPEAVTAPAPWELSAALLWSDPPGADERWTALAYAERGALHLELRHGYEDEDTLAFFAGWNTQPCAALALVPMLGLVAGRTDALAPALELEASWRRFTWYAESEWLLDLHAREDDYVYAWSTLTWACTDALALGLVSERTRLVDTGLELQRGLALEYTRGACTLALYAYNPEGDDAYGVLSLGFAP